MKIVFTVMLLFVIGLMLYIECTKENMDQKAQYTAIIIEPREHKALSFVLRSFLNNLSSQWDVIVFHGNKNIQYLENIITNDLAEHKNRIKLINLNVDNLTIGDYNKLLLSESFYNNIPTEVFLVFQTDTLINDKNKEKINDFLQYDYVGAPWRDFGFNVGNGGLSLRRKSKILEKIRKCPYKGENEDMYFANDECIKLNKPSGEKAKEFSVETIYYENPFGVHKPNGNLSNEELEMLKKNVNGLDELIRLQ
jgi:hypothetical protein